MCVFGRGILKQDPETALKNGHPGPEVELEFWDAKADNLNSLHTQLSGEKIRKVIKVLEVTKSTYFPAFNRLCKEVCRACMSSICLVCVPCTCALYVCLLSVFTPSTAVAFCVSLRVCPVCI